MGPTEGPKWSLLPAAPVVTPPHPAQGHQAGRGHVAGRVTDQVLERCAGGRKAALPGDPRSCATCDHTEPRRSCRRASHIPREDGSLWEAAGGWPPPEESGAFHSVRSSSSAKWRTVQAQSTSDSNPRVFNVEKQKHAGTPEGHVCQNRLPGPAAPRPVRSHSVRPDAPSPDPDPPVVGQTDGRNAVLCEEDFRKEGGSL